MSTTTSVPFPPDARLEDYLDDKLQSASDLSSLPTLLATIETQRSQLQAQLDDATQTLSSVRQAAHDRQDGLSAQITAFDQLQHDMAARSSMLASSHAPDEAVARLATPMRQLHHVDLARGYVGLLLDVEGASGEARACLPGNPKEALKPYTRLRTLGKRMAELRLGADEAAGHLMRHVDGLTEMLWEDMKGTMSAEMEAVLKERSWPAGVDPETSRMDEEWLRVFAKCLDLQMPEVLYSSPSSGATATAVVAATTPISLLPVDVMAKPLIQWFRFQFMGDTATSTPQAFPEMCIPNFVNLVDKWADFFRANLSDLLASRFQKTRLAGHSAYLDPACVLLTSLLPIMRQKINLCVLHGLKNPQYLSNLMVQLMNLDDTLRDRFNYYFVSSSPSSFSSSFSSSLAHEERSQPQIQTLTSSVLSTNFRPWLHAEKEFALRRYTTIMSAADAHTLDHDYSAPGKPKPTFGAVRVVDLLRSVTQQYARLERLPHKLRFLVDIHLELLDRYHAKLADSLDAYAALTSTVARTLQGIGREEAAVLEGTGGLEALCKVLGSAEHIINTLKLWGNEGFFVALWEELRQRAREEGEKEKGGAIAGLSLEQVKDRTSNAVVGGGGADGNRNGDGGQGVDAEEEEATIFDETVKFYGKRRDVARGFLEERCKEDCVRASRPYLAKALWSGVSGAGEEGDAGPVAVTAELDEVLRILNRNTAFLTTTLSTALHRAVLRTSLSTLQDTLWHSLLMKHSFTTLGARQLALDVDALCAVVERHVPGSSAALGKLRDAVVLLSLPVNLEGVDGDAADAGGGDVKGEGVMMTLRQVSDRVFKDNEEARSVLRELGLDGSLDPAEARRILQRRVEASE